MGKRATTTSTTSTTASDLDILNQAIDATMGRSEKVSELTKLLIAGKRNDQAIKQLILSKCASIVLHGNCVPLQKDIVVPLCSYKPDTDVELDRGRLIIDWLKSFGLEVDRKTGSLSLTHEKDYYNKEWFAELRETSWVQKANKVSEWKSPFDSAVGSYAQGLLTQSITWAEISEEISLKMAQAINVQVSNPKAQSKAEGKMSKLGYEDYKAPVDSLRREYVEIFVGA